MTKFGNSVAFILGILLTLPIWLALDALAQDTPPDKAPASRYFCFATAMGVNNKGVGKTPAVAQIGHMTLAPGGTIEGSYWEIHSYAANSPLMATGKSGPIGPVMRPRPSRVVYNPSYKMSWTEADNRLSIKVGTITYNWLKGKDTDDPDRYETQGFLPGEWSAGFGYFSDSLVSPALKGDDLAYAYSGEQYVSAGGVWQIRSPRQGAGVSTYLFSPTKLPYILQYGWFAADDGTGLQVGEQIGLNCIPHSNLWIIAYGGHDYNGDGKITATGDGGHDCEVELVKRAGKLDRGLYLENSYQVTGATDQYHGWPVNGNIVCCGYLKGLFLPPDLVDLPINTTVTK